MKHILFFVTLRTFVLIIASVATALSVPAATYYVSTTGQDDAGRDGLSPGTAWKSIAYAFQQVPAGNHTIQLGTGTFVLSQAAPLKSGWTLNGQGRTGSNTTTIINASTFGPNGAICFPLSQEKQDYPLENYLLGGNGLENVTISNLVLTSRADQPLDGAIMMKYARNLELFNLSVREFRWNGIYLREGKQVRIHHSSFEDASYTRLCNTWGGAVRTRYMKDFELDHCAFKTTKGGAYGYKASGHENARIHDNIFHNNTSLGPNDNRPFDLESAHEFEWGLEIYNNTFNGMVSVPRAGGQADPSDRGDYTYTVRIHDNVFYGSGGVEGPRNYLEIDHNYFANKWGNNGRVYEIHGGANAGPTTIHHNVAECSMGFVFKKNELNENISILNNTVYLMNSTRHNFPTSFLEVSGPVNNWQVKNNVVFTQDSPNSGTAFSRGSLPSTGMSLSHNVAWNVPGSPAGVTSTNPGLALGGQKPTAYYAPSGAGSYVVDRGTNVGFPYQGSTPDIGAYEYQPAANPTGIISGSIYELEPQCAPGKRLDAKGAKTANGTNVQIYQQNGGSNQRWKVVDEGNGYYELIPQHATDKRLDVSGMSSSNGANIHLWQNYSNAAQRWKITDQGNGYYELEPQCAPGKRLDVAGMGSANGTNVHLWQDYSNAAQRWKFILKSNNARTISEKTKSRVEEALVEQDLQFYPNPAKGQLQVAVPPGALPTQLHIHDLLGRLWLEKVLSESQSVDVRRLPPGVYTIHLQQGKEIQTQKLVIEQ